MAYRHEVEVTITSAKDLKNVNWRDGRLNPYAVVWVDSKNKCSTRVDEEGNTCPNWNQNLVIPVNSPIEDSTLYIDIVHANAAEGVNPLIGSARLPLLDFVGLGEISTRRLDLKRPSETARGQVKVKVAVRELPHRAPEPYYPQPYGVTPTSKYYPAPNHAPPPSGNPAPSAYGGLPASSQPHEMGFKKVQKINYGKADILISTNKDADLYYIGGRNSLISGLPTNNSGIHYGHGGGSADGEPQYEESYYEKADIVWRNNYHFWNTYF